ncbi:TM2 domain-containing protein [Bacillus australimaris]|uniref:TM2 domain-containing protein n=1 Tax=Bacillus australimaris TaxID=1326968 RepID=UPI0039B5B872
MDNLLLEKSGLTDHQRIVVSTELQAKKKSKLVVFLLWWFLGAFAIHRFYLDEKKGYAVVMLLLGWLTLFIWPFIDGIICLVKTVDEINENIERNIIASVKNA